MTPRVSITRSPYLRDPAVQNPAIEKVVHPSGLEVAMESESQSIVLRIETSDWVGITPLSLPAAHQLARTPRKEVKKYLNQETE